MTFEEWWESLPSDGSENADIKLCARRAYRFAHTVGQKAMRERAADLASSLFTGTDEKPFCEPDSFMYWKDVAEAIQDLPIEGE